MPNLRPIQEDQDSPDIIASWVQCEAILKESDRSLSSVLVACRNSSDANAVSRQLGHTGFRCEISTNAIDVLYKVTTGDFRMVFLEVDIAPWNAFETSGMIRNYQDSHSEMRLFLVGLASKQGGGQLARCLQANMDGCVEMASLPHRDRLLHG